MSRSLRYRIIKLTLATIAATLLIGGATAWYIGGRLLEPAPQVIGAHPDGFAVEDISIDADSGNRLSGWFHAGDPGRGVVVLLHGIRTNRRSSVHRAKLFAEAGFSTLLFDLRGHGESPGELITLGCHEADDARAAVAWARRRCPADPVAVVGFSLGGAAAVLASPLDIDALVLEAVYPTIEAAVDNRTERQLGWLGPLASKALLMQLEPRTGVACSNLRPVDAVADAGCPVLIVGGGKDQHTTPEDTRQLFAAATEPKQLVWFPEWGHNNYARWAPERYRTRVVDFVKEYLPAKTSAPGQP